MSFRSWLIGVAVTAQVAVGGLARAQSDGPPEQDWPRQFDSPAGPVVIYEPQPDTFQGQTLNGRAAFALTPPGKTDPLFGAFWFSAQVSTDREKRVLQLTTAKVTEVKLPDSPADTQRTLSAFFEQQLPNVTLSLDKVTEGLADSGEEKAGAPPLKFNPPKITFATEPTVLVLLDGQPVRRPIEKTGVDAVVNTPFPLFYDNQSQRFYLTNGALWYATPDVLNGPWEVIPTPPPNVVAVVSKGDKKDQGAPVAADAAPPRILVATEPTELVVTKGVPSFAPVNDTQLLQVTNADESIFRDLNSQRLFIVLAGRWYSAPGFEGPWAYIPSDKLPQDFAKIPPASSAGNVLAFVSGTPQANQAVADAEIPQTAEVKRDAPPPQPITYDGQPDFQPIAGAAPGVSYAVNTPNSVLLIDGTYYSVVNAVWYMAPSAQGPWSVATSVPQQVQTIPPASPVYNVRYVYVYQATPTVVYTGYTPGYLGSYSYGGVVVYGTGYAYRPWVSGYVYYPRPVTWGFGVAYNPYTGWSYGVGPSAYFLHYGAVWGGGYYGWRPAYGGAWYGPGGYRPPPYHYGGGWYSPGYRAAYYQPHSPYYGGYAGYGRAGYGGAWARPANGLYSRPGFSNYNVQRPVAARPAAWGRPAPAAFHNTVVADRQGNVLRQSPNGAWQQHTSNGGWRQASAPSNVGRSGVTSPGAFHGGGPSASTGGYHSGGSTAGQSGAHPGGSPSGGFHPSGSTPPAGASHPGGSTATPGGHPAGSTVPPGGHATGSTVPPGGHPTGTAPPGGHPGSGPPGGHPAGATAPPGGHPPSGQAGHSNPPANHPSKKQK